MTRALLIVSVLTLAPACSHDREVAKAGVTQAFDVCYAYRRSVAAEGAADDAPTAMLPSEGAIVAYRKMVEGANAKQEAEVLATASRLLPGTKLRRLWRGPGWIKVLVVGSPKGNVAGYVLDSECHPLPPRGVLTLP